MNSSLPEPLNAPVGAAASAPAGVHRLYRRLGRLGFRWLYVLDAVVVLASGAVVMTVRFGVDWPQPGESLLGLVAFMVLVQVVFYFGGLYERQSRLGNRQWFARVAGLTLVALGVSALVVLPTDRYAVPRWNLAAVGVLVALAATGNRVLSRRLRTKPAGFCWSARPQTRLWLPSILVRLTVLRSWSARRVLMRTCWRRRTARVRPM